MPNNDFSIKEMESGRDGEFQRHLSFRTSHLIKFVEKMHKAPGATCLDMEALSLNRTSCRVRLVNTKSANKVKPLCSTTPAAVLCLLGHTVPPPCFHSHLFGFGSIAALIHLSVFSFTQICSGQQI